MKKYLIICADYNDGDYVTERTEVNDKDLVWIRPIVEAIKANGTHCNFNNREPREGEVSAEDTYGHLDRFEDFLELCPTNEYGIHTIARIQLITVVEEERLL